MKERKCLPGQRVKHLKDVFPLLQLASQTDGHGAKSVLTYADDNAVLALCECVQNALTNPNVLSKEQRDYLKTKLNGQKKQIRDFVRPKLSSKQRRRKGIQLGGSLGLIISAVLPFLTNLLFK